MSDNQKEIIRFALDHGNKITTKQAQELLAGQYYCNGNKHVSEILTRMVRNQTLKREKIGHYKLIMVQSKGPVTIDHKSQTKLL